MESIQNMVLGNPHCEKCQTRHPPAYDCEVASKELAKQIEVAISGVKRKKYVYVGAPACFILERECQYLNSAFNGRCYLVGSALERDDWRDIDVRMIMSDDEFAALFPDASSNWEFDPRWIVMTTAISQQLTKQTGLPVDFQFQPQTHANERHKGPRNALGLRFAKGG